MPCLREEHEKRERDFLAAYAQTSSDSRGRRYEETPPDWRTHYQRDRDRVIHSRAFRRLEYKTQVFLNGTGDHLRTRLTHTMEVAAGSRSIARALKLNEDLTETIALAHDLGHPPFGHKGEHVLNKLMQDFGGFEHNRQSLRIVEELEQKYPGFPGLNLTWEVREGLIKHNTAHDEPALATNLVPTSPFPSLEAQVANIADEITYYSHDLDDGLDSGLLSEDQLYNEVRIWHAAASKVKKEFGRLPDECRRYFIIRCIIDEQVRDVVHTTEHNILNANIRDTDDVRNYSHPLAAYSQRLQSANNELRKFLYKNLYYNPEVHEPNLRAVNMLEQLFHHFMAHPEDIGLKSQKRAKTSGWERCICDYLSGMTDRYAISEFKKIFGND
ncbi:MAG: deoxyguanosinetriphosphate triphosphohydrolase [Verrucomicrobia bacterium]|nr:deoxyguanosinetriphosphate triphosphohydrolase [Verrucomicrobiota bacterium]MCF7707950.1 deoxyguanosinetriphosphate triphosphohydrolase [Verrucomicrobiota bacterium]